MTPSFLTIDEIHVIHRDQVHKYGGSLGVRDEGLLESAVALPRQQSCGTYLHSGVFEMAAAYLFHIVRNHPFVDGNKRTGAASGIVFLEMNGFRLDAQEDELLKIVLKCATGEIEKQQIAQFFRVSCVEK